MTEATLMKRLTALVDELVDFRMAEALASVARGLRKATADVVPAPKTKAKRRTGKQRYSAEKKRKMERGECLECKEPAAHGRLRCQPHLDRVNERTKAWYEARKARIAAGGES